MVRFLFSIALAVFLWGTFTLPTKSLQTQVTACDVGQGDAILVQHGTWVMLIDTGPNSAVLRCLSEKLPFWRKKIDVLVLTHSDKDHIGGVEAVLSSFRVGEIWRTPWEELSASGVEVENLLKKTPTRLVESGESLSLPGVRWRILWGKKLYDRRFSRYSLEKGTNAQSVALWGRGESFGFLAAGDLSCAEELALPIGTLLKQVQILKVSHHGSKSSSCLDFLKQVRPETVIVSSGVGNSYGHPHPITLENLQKMGVFILRTDQLGSFTVTAGGNFRSYQIDEGNGGEELGSNFNRLKVQSQRAVY